MLIKKTSNEIEIHQVLSGRSNSWLLHSSDLNILVDSGIDPDPAQIIKNLNSILNHSEELDYLFLTHTHFDHCRSASRIREHFKCRIIAGEAEANYTIKGFTPLPAGTLLPAKIISNIGKMINSKRFHYESFKPDIQVKEEAEIEGKLKIQVVPTPGHSIGSISLVVNNEIAIVGDAMFGIFRDSIFPPFADDKKELVRSWKKLLDTACIYFLPGHGKGIRRERLEWEFKKYSEKFHI